MKRQFSLRFALTSLRERSVRSWLTVSGVIVSIAVIVILLTLTTGLQAAIVDLFEEFGAGRIQIMSRGAGPMDFGAGLLDKDVETVEGLPYFDLVLEYLVIGAGQVEYRGEERFLMLTGVPTSKASATDASYSFTADAAAGRYFRDNERGVVMLGYNVANEPDDFFGRTIDVRTTMIVGGERFRVVGVMRQFGTPDDDMIWMPLEDMREVFDRPHEVTMMTADVRSGLDIGDVARRTHRELERRKGEDTVTVLTPDALLRQFDALLGIVQGLLLAIASISMVVGALGIANTMFTSVLEREKEIGVMKSVGAQNRDILFLFTLESALIGLFGGILGVGLGIGVSYLIGFIAVSAGFLLLTISISPVHIIVALVFSLLVGAFSGLPPALRASRKNIVDSLRAY